MQNQALFTTLNQKLASSFFVAQNPVISRVTAGEMSTETLGEVLRQYVLLPEVIVSLLHAGSKHFPKKSPVCIELARNMGQEQGAGTGRVPHVDLLKAFLLRDLKLDASHVLGSAATDRFLAQLRDGVTRERGACFALGQIYALEASATPELACIIGPAVNAYGLRTGRGELVPAHALRVDGQYSLPHVETRAQALAMSMADWLALHIVDFEAGHRDRLREAADEVLLDDESRALCHDGFMRTLMFMDEWWSALAAM